MFSKIINHIPICRAVVAGGGAPEIELSIRLSQEAQAIKGVDSYCFRFV